MFSSHLRVLRDDRAQEEEGLHSVQLGSLSGWWGCVGLGSSWSLQPTSLSGHEIQVVDLKKFWTETPLDAQSAGFKQPPLINLWSSLNSGNSVGNKVVISGSFILYVFKRQWAVSPKNWSRGSSSSSRIFSSIRTATVAVLSSILGMVTGLRGSTLALPMRKAQWTYWCLFIICK